MSKEEEAFWVDLVSNLVPLMVRIDIGFGPDGRRAALISAGLPSVEVRYADAGPMMYAPPTRGWVSFDLRSLKQSLGLGRVVV
jgi:hypothetical protein